MSPKSPALTVDGVVLRDDLVLLVKRQFPPFKGMWALPGGFVEYGETTEQAVLREIQEETGLKVQVASLLGVYSDPGRDPRGHTVSVVYILGELSGRVRAGDDAAEAQFFSINSLPDLAFDHEKILKDVLIHGA